MNEKTKPVALVTGASSGIGAVYADRLAQRGYDLILVARREDRLKALAQHIGAANAVTVETVVADLGERSALKRVEELLRHDARISLLVNNAGTAAVTPLLNSDVDGMSAMIDLNVNALVRLAYAAVPGFVERSGGTIINIASIVAVGPEMLNGVYGASKSFVLAFSQSLKHELADKGIRVQVVLPGATATDLWANAGLPVANLPKEIVMQTEPMVDAALAGLDLGEFVTIPALADIQKWHAYETARQALIPIIGGSAPAARYRTAGALKQA
jgi:short-subunit dehydrogenase